MQPERTTLSWTRTLVSLLAVSAVLLRWVPHFGPALAVAALAVCSAAAIIAAGQQRRLHAQVRRICAGGSTVDVGAHLGLVACVLLVALIGMCCIVFGG